MSDSKNVLLVTNDLFFLPRAQAAAVAAGMTLRRIGSKADFDDAYSQDGAAFVLIDLESDHETWRRIAASVTSAAGTRPTVVAYGPHIEEELLAEARELGCDPVLPKGAFISRLPKMLASKG